MVLLPKREQSVWILLEHQPEVGTRGTSLQVAHMGGFFPWLPLVLERLLVLPEQLLLSSRLYTNVTSKGAWD